MPDNTVLVETLALAVPFRIDELQQKHSRWRTRIAQRWAARATDLVACHGDMLMFPSKARKKHTKECVERSEKDKCSCLVGTAEVFNAMAKGLAALAHQPGGVTFMGLHWCMLHRAGLRADVRYDLACEAHGWDGENLPRLPAWRPFGGRPVVTVELPEAVS